MQTILIILGLYLLYKFIVDFVIPVYKTTQKMRQQFHNMHQQMKDNVNGGQRSSNGSSVNNKDPRHSKVSSKDYIDFEEIRN